LLAAALSFALCAHLCLVHRPFPVLLLLLFFCSKFAVPEARWYWIKLSALAAAHDCEALDAHVHCAHTPVINA
jgi:hypothetical protein